MNEKEYDVCKYHIVTTLYDSYDRQQKCKETISSIYPNFDGKVNFYYSSKTNNKKFKFLNVFDNYLCDQMSIDMYNRPGSYGCSTSYLYSIRLAKSLDWPYVFIFEDDILINSEIRNLKYYVDNTNYDFYFIVLGYWGKKLKFKKINDYFKLYSRGQIGGGHDMFIPKKSYDILLNILYKKLFIRDGLYTIPLFQPKILYPNIKMVSLSGCCNESVIGRRYQ